MKIIAIANQKGGVGKTSTCLHIAGVLAERGMRLLVVDMDQQGTSHRFLLTTFTN